MPWTPSSGDRFVVDRPELEAEVFVVSDMVAQVVDFVDGAVVGFNGTVEWALDSVAVDDVVWLPREDQLRAALGGRFVAFRSAPGGFVVELADGSRHTDADAESAYGKAVLGALDQQGRSDAP